MAYLRLYGLNGVANALPLPVQATSDPSTTTSGYVFGQQWINTSTGNIFTFTGSVNGVNIWAGGGGVGTFSSITVSGPAGSSINGGLLINSGTASSTTISAGASTGNVGILNGTGTGTVAIGNANAGNVSVNTGASLTLGAAAATIRVGSVAGTSNTEIFSFKAVADAATSANAAFTANAGIVTVAISNLNTANGASGTITMTNSTIIATTGALISATITGAGAVQFNVTKAVPTNGVLTISYTNGGAASFNAGNVVYLSIMVVS